MPPGRLPGCPRVIAVALMLLMFPMTAGASRVNYLARDDSLCDSARQACIRATLSYDVNPRLLWLRGRVQSAPGPGMLQILLTGTTRLGYVRYAPMEVSIRGHSSEIVDFRMIPDHPDVENWEIDRVTFRPEAGE